MSSMNIKMPDLTYLQIKPGNNDVSLLPDTDIYVSTKYFNPRFPLNFEALSKASSSDSVIKVLERDAIPEPAVNADQKPADHEDDEDNYTPRNCLIRLNRYKERQITTHNSSIRIIQDKNRQLDESLEDEKRKFLEEREKLRVERYKKESEEMRKLYEHLPQQLASINEKARKKLQECEARIREAQLERERLAQLSQKSKEAVSLQHSKNTDRQKSPIIINQSFTPACDTPKSETFSSAILSQQVDTEKSSNVAVSSQISNDLIQHKAPSRKETAVPIATKSSIPQAITQETPERQSFPSTKHNDHAQYLRGIHAKAFLLVCEYEEAFKPFIESPSDKPYRMDLVKVISTSINTISKTTPLQPKIDTLVLLLSGNSVVVVGTQRRVSTSGHPMGPRFALYTVADRIVRQCYTQLDAEPGAVFPLAKLTVSLCTKFPRLVDILRAVIFFRCPYLVPFYCDENEDDRAYQINCVRREGETEDKFVKRIATISRLFAAILQSSELPGKQHPFGLHNGWALVANILRVAPRSDITASVLHSVLQVAGHKLSIVYGKQFQKLICLLYTEYFKLLKQDQNSGPIARLEELLVTAYRTRQIPPPDM